ncbi:MAG: hypothetical protein RIT81_40565 [Deltaproteobacteria bacterium]
MTTLSSPGPCPEDRTRSPEGHRRSSRPTPSLPDDALDLLDDPIDDGPAAVSSLLSRARLPITAEGILWFIGVVLVLAGSLYFTESNWDRWSPPVRASVVTLGLVLYQALFVGLAAFLAGRRAPALPVRVLAGLGAALVVMIGWSAAALAGHVLVLAIAAVIAAAALATVAMRVGDVNAEARGVARWMGAAAGAVMIAMTCSRQPALLATSVAAVAMLLLARATWSAATASRGVFGFAATYAAYLGVATTVGAATHPGVVPAWIFAPAIAAVAVVVDGATLRRVAGGAATRIVVMVASVTALGFALTSNVVPVAGRVAVLVTAALSTWALFVRARRDGRRLPMALAVVSGLFVYFFLPAPFTAVIELVLSSAKSALGYDDRPLPVAYYGVTFVPYLAAWWIAERRGALGGLASAVRLVLFGVAATLIALAFAQWSDPRPVLFTVPIYILALAIDARIGRTRLATAPAIPVRFGSTRFTAVPVHAACVLVVLYALRATHAWLGADVWFFGLAAAAAALAPWARGVSGAPAEQTVTEAARRTIVRSYATAAALAAMAGPLVIVAVALPIDPGLAVATLALTSASLLTFASPRVELNALALLGALAAGIGSRPDLAAPVTACVAATWCLLGIVPGGATSLAARRLAPLGALGGALLALLGGGAWWPAAVAILVLSASALRRPWWTVAAGLVSAALAARLAPQLALPGPLTVGAVACALSWLAHVLGARWRAVDAAAERRSSSSGRATVTNDADARAQSASLASADAGWSDSPATIQYAPGADLASDADVRSEAPTTSRRTPSADLGANADARSDSHATSPRAPSTDLGPNAQAGDSPTTSPRAPSTDLGANADVRSEAPATSPRAPSTDLGANADARSDSLATSPRAARADERRDSPATSPHARGAELGSIDASAPTAPAPRGIAKIASSALARFAAPLDVAALASGTVAAVALVRVDPSAALALWLLVVVSVALRWVRSTPRLATLTVVAGATATLGWLEPRLLLAPAAFTIALALLRSAPARRMRIAAVLAAVLATVATVDTIEAIPFALGLLGAATIAIHALTHGARRVGAVLAATTAFAAAVELPPEGLLVAVAFLAPLVYARWRHRPAGTTAAPASRSHRHGTANEALDGRAPTPEDGAEEHHRTATHDAPREAAIAEAPRPLHHAPHEHAPHGHVIAEARRPLHHAPYEHAMDEAPRTFDDAAHDATIGDVHRRALAETSTAHEASAPHDVPSPSPCDENHGATTRGASTSRASRRAEASPEARLAFDFGDAAHDATIGDAHRRPLAETSTAHEASARHDVPAPSPCAENHGATKRGARTSDASPQAEAAPEAFLAFDFEALVDVANTRARRATSPWCLLVFVAPLLALLGTASVTAGTPFASALPSACALVLGMTIVGRPWRSLAPLLAAWGGFVLALLAERALELPLAIGTSVVALVGTIACRLYEARRRPPSALLPRLAAALAIAAAIVTVCVDAPFNVLRSPYTFAGWFAWLAALGTLLYAISGLRWVHALVLAAATLGGLAPLFDLIEGVTSLPNGTSYMWAHVLATGLLAILPSLHQTDHGAGFFKRPFTPGVPAFVVVLMLAVGAFVAVALQVTGGHVVSLPILGLTLAAVFVAHTHRARFTSHAAVLTVLSLGLHVGADLYALPGAAVGTASGALGILAWGRGRPSANVVAFTAIGVAVCMTRFATHGFSTSLVLAILTAALALLYTRTPRREVLMLGALAAAGSTTWGWFGVGRILSTGQGPIHIVPFVASGFLAVAALLYVLRLMYAPPLPRGDEARHFDRPLAGARRILVAAAVLATAGHVTVVAEPRTLALLLNLVVVSAGLATFARAAQRGGRGVDALLVQGTLFVAWCLLRRQFAFLAGIDHADAYAMLAAAFAYTGVHALVQRGALAPAYARSARLFSMLLPVGAALFFEPDVSWRTCAMMTGASLAYAFAARIGVARVAAPLATILLNAATVVAWVKAGVQDPQLYALPIGASCLFLAHLYQKELSDSAVATIRVIALFGVYLSSFVSVLTFDAPSHSLVMAVLAVLGALAGVTLRVRSYLLLGAGFLVVDLGTSVVRFGLSGQTAATLVLTCLGLALLGGLVVWSLHRRQIVDWCTAFGIEVRQWEV